jgi:hypothetical protein
MYLQLFFSKNKSWLGAGLRVSIEDKGGREISAENAQSLLISASVRFTKPSTALVPDSFLTGTPSHNPTFKAS